jgi:hypothetical protein
MIYPGDDWFSLQTDKESIPDFAPVFPGAARQGSRQPSVAQRQTKRHQHQSERVMPVNLTAAFKFRSASQAESRFGFMGMV